MFIVKRLNHVSQTNRMLPTIIESLQGLNMIRIASMSTFTLALDSDGRVYVWGTGKLKIILVLSNYILILWTIINN